MNKQQTNRKGFRHLVWGALLTLLAGTSVTAQIACTIDPSIATNVAGEFHVFSVFVTASGQPFGFVPVTFSIISGPNAGVTDTAATDLAGEAAFFYFSDGRLGTDVIRAITAGTTTCTAVKVWAKVANERPVAFCRDVSAAAGSDCAAHVPASEVDDGSFDYDGEIVAMTLTPPGPFSVGTTPVVFTVRDDYGDTDTCNALITVADLTPPALACPIQLVTNLPVGVSNAIVNFATPPATDNCDPVVAVCEPRGGSDFVLGTNAVVCTATDSSGNTNTCEFNVILREEPAEPHDLAIVKLKGPKKVTLSAAVPAVTALATVSIANLGENDETITSLDGLVTLVAQSLGGECSNAVVALHAGLPNKPLPVTLAPRKKLNVVFDITFNCVHDSLKGVGHEDYRILATVDHVALGTGGDSNLANDDCPRLPNSLTGDKGCGGKGGSAVFTDLFVK